MKLLHFDDFKLGVLKGDAVVDVSAEVGVGGRGHVLGPREIAGKPSEIGL